MGERETSIIVGAGLGGVSAAGALRQSGYAGRVLLINGESELPYDRPPLSKTVLLGAEDLSNLYLKPESWYRENEVELISGVAVQQIRDDGHEVQLSDGRVLRYQHLLLTTGADVRRVPVLEQGAIPCFYLRTYRDSVALQAQLVPGRHLLIVGAGIIGLEVAASAVRCGCQVSVMEIADRVMARTMPESMSAWLQRQHESRGVRFYLENSVSGFDSDDDGAAAVLAGGERIRADLMLIAAGITPAVDLAEQGGLACDNGIVVNEYGQTSSEDIYAAGDAAAYPDAWLERSFRSENWMHAMRQAECAARNMAGAHEPYREIQSGWTDQYDFKLQVAGVFDGDQQILRGDWNSGSFMIFQLREGRVVGLLGVNQAKFMRLGQNLIKSKATVDTAVLSDPAGNLKKAAIERIG